MLKRACVLVAVLGAVLWASTVTISADIDPDEIPQVGLPDGLVMEVFLADLKFPVSMAWTADGELFFTEKATGRVRYYDGERLRETPFAELPVNAQIERGLLGVTVDPTYAENGLVYIFYTHADPLSNRVIRMRNEEGTGVDPVVLLDAPITTGFFNHNGGNTAFGPDGMLYVTLGENNFPPWSAQLDVPYGKILRIDPADGSAPVDNPFYDDGDPATGNDDRIFAYGLRNPFDLAFRPGAGELYVSENGPACDDEINLIRSASDYGWRVDYPCPEGLDVGWPAVESFTPAFAPTGLVFYDGEPLAAYSGDLFMCSWIRGYLMRIELGEAGIDGLPLVENIESWGRGCGTDITVGPDGFLYISHAGWGPSEGTIRRVRPGELASDWPLANGHFFTQAALGAGGEGYAVTDNEDAPFHSEFERLGGIEVLGFPASNRYTRDGGWFQAFERAVLRWDPWTGTAVFTNVLDDLSAAGLDDILLDEHGIVGSEAWVQDVGLPFDEVIQNHLELLNRSTLIRDTFLANDRWLQQYGLPMGFEDSGDMTVLRSQRVVLILDRSSSSPRVRIVWGTELAMDVDYMPAGALRRRP